MNYSKLALFLKMILLLISWFSSYSCNFLVLLWLTIISSSSLSSFLNSSISMILP